MHSLKIWWFKYNGSSGWLQFWETKFLEFSLRFPGHFKIFPWATPESKIRWNAFLLAIMSYSYIFPEFSTVFPEFSEVFSTKIQISPSFPWDFDNFPNSPSFPGFPWFPGLWPPCSYLLDIYTEAFVVFFWNRYLLKLNHHTFAAYTSVVTFLIEIF